MSSNFWEFLWLILSTFLLLTYLLVLFQIIIDLFRDHTLGGVAKAIWVVFLIALPMLTALAYLIVRGNGMASRRNSQISDAQAEADAYIRRVAGTSPAEQITAAKALLDAGTISASEFASLKAKALA